MREDKLTTDQQVELIVQAMEFPTVGRRAKVKRDLIYTVTALGGTFIPVMKEEEEEGK